MENGDITAPYLCLRANASINCKKNLQFFLNGMSESVLIQSITFWHFSCFQKRNGTDKVMVMNFMINELGYVKYAYGV